MTTENSSKSDPTNTVGNYTGHYNNFLNYFNVSFSLSVPPKIVNGSQCMVEGKLLVCVCISRGNPLPPITWPSATLTDFSVTSSSSIQTVTSTITMPAAVFHNTTVKCISSNKLGQAEIEIPIQNNPKNLKSNCE